MTPDLQALNVRAAQAMGKHCYLGVLRLGSRCTSCGADIDDEVHSFVNYTGSTDAAMTLVDFLLSKPDTSFGLNHVSLEWTARFFVRGRLFSASNSNRNVAIVTAALAVFDSLEAGR